MSHKFSNIFDPPPYPLSSANTFLLLIPMFDAYLNVVTNPVPLSPLITAFLLPFTIIG